MIAQLANLFEPSRLTFLFLTVDYPSFLKHFLVFGTLHYLVSSTNCSFFHSTYGLSPLTLQSKELSKALSSSPINLSHLSLCFKYHMSYNPKITSRWYLFCELLTYAFKCQQDISTLVFLYHLKYISKLIISSKKLLLLVLLLFLLMSSHFLSQPRLRTLIDLLL